MVRTMIKGDTGEVNIINLNSNHKTISKDLRLEKFKICEENWWELLYRMENK